MCEKPVTPSPFGKYLDSDTWDALRAAGVSETDLQDDQPFGPMIASYTRAQAIADGTLVDLTADGEMKLLCQQAGLKLPIAMTATAFHGTVLVGTTETPDGEFVFPASQSGKGRLWDVLMVLRMAIRSANSQGDTDRVAFNVMVDANGNGKHSIVKLWCQIGPGDDAEPVLTIMLENED